MPYARDPDGRLTNPAEVQQLVEVLTGSQGFPRQDIPAIYADMVGGQTFEAAVSARYGSRTGRERISASAMAGWKQLLESWVAHGGPQRATSPGL